MEFNWIKRSLVIGALGALAFALGSCSAAATAHQNDAKIGCHFDAVKVCQNALMKPVASSSGITTSNQSYISQNSPITTWLQAPVHAPGGSEIDVQCEVNYSQRKVIYANAVPSGTVSDPDRQWLQNHGLCTGVAGNQAMPNVGATD